MREIRGTDLSWIMVDTPLGGTAALVVDENGIWPWWRRDYIEIRAYVELGFNDAFDYAQREK